MNRQMCKRFSIITCHIALQIVAILAYKDDAPIFQPGPGAVLRLFDSSRDLKYIANLVSTQFQQNDHFTPQSGYMLAYFLPPKDGAYYFSISCGASSQLLLTDLKLSELKISQSTSVELRQRFRYRIKLSFKSPTSCKLKVRLPNTEDYVVIEHQHLHRTMALYHSWDFLEQVLDMNALVSSDNIKDFYASNLSYRTAISYYSSNKKIEVTNSRTISLFLGYTTVPSRAVYTFRLFCSFFCGANITDQTSDKMYELWHDSTLGATELEFHGSRQLSVEVLIVGQGRLEAFSKNSTGHLLPTRFYSSSNLNSGSYHTNIKPPIMKAINSSAIKVELRNTPRLNAREHWGAAKKNEIACFLGSTPVHHFKNLTGAYPISVVLASLRNFTTYKCNALYFGNMYGHEYNIVSAFEARHTAENIPSQEPRNVKATCPAFYTIRLVWSTIPAEHRHGILSFIVYYKVASSLSWSRSNSITATYFVSGNLDVDFYDYKVCGQTNAGEGPCSEAVRAKPLTISNEIENAPFTAFATNLNFADKTLVHYTTATHLVNSVEECHQKCIDCQSSSNCCCVSFNLQRSLSGTKRICEINHETAEHFPRNLVKKKGCQYYNML